MKQLFFCICLGSIAGLCFLTNSEDLSKSAPTQQKLVDQSNRFQNEQLSSHNHDLSRTQNIQPKSGDEKQVFNQNVPNDYKKNYERGNLISNHLASSRFNNSNPFNPEIQNTNQLEKSSKVVSQTLAVDDFQVNDNTGRVDAYSPKVAIDQNGNYVVVWKDYRNNNSDIYGQHFNDKGVRQGSNFKVNDDNGSSSQEDPQIAMDNNGNFIVVWQDERNGNKDIYGQRYNNTGTKESANFLINDDQGGAEQYDQRIAADGSGNFVVVWEDKRMGSNIYAQRYTSSGVKQGTNFLVYQNASYPAISSDVNGNFVVVCNSHGEIYGQRYTMHGVKEDPQFIVTDQISYPNAPAVGMDQKGNFVVAWRCFISMKYGGSYIAAQRYTSSGAKQGTNFEISTNSFIDYSVPEIALDGNNNFLIVWDNTSDIYGQWYINGTQQGSNSLINENGVSSVQEGTGVASNMKGNFVVVWGDARNGNSAIYAQIFTQSHTKQGTNFLVSDETVSLDQHSPALVVDGSGNFITVWCDERNGHSDIYGQKCTSSGVKLGANFLINDDTDNSNQQSPAIAADTRGNFVVVWKDGQNGKSDIYGRLFSNGGTKEEVIFLVNDEHGSVGESTPKIALDDNGNFIVVWQDVRNGNPDIYGQRFSHGAVQQGSKILINDDPGSAAQSDPDVAMDVNGNFVVVWQDHRDTKPQIYGQKYDNGGNKLNTNFKMFEGPYCEQQLKPAIAMKENGNFVVVWLDKRDVYWYIFGQRYSHTASKLGGNFCVFNNEPRHQPNSPAIAIACNENIVVVWSRLYDCYIPWLYQKYTEQGLFAQICDSTGQNVSSNFKVDRDPESSNQIEPKVKIFKNLIYYCWTDNRMPGQGRDIFACIGEEPRFISVKPGNEQLTDIPKEFKLDQNYPNPFNSETILRYHLPAQSFVSLTIFDINGREIIQLFKGDQHAGTYSFTWNACDRHCVEVPSGVYIYQLRAGNHSENRKMVLVK